MSKAGVRALVADALICGTAAAAYATTRCAPDGSAVAVWMVWATGVLLGWYALAWWWAERDWPDD